GVARARAHSNCGAVVRRSASRSADGVAVMAGRWRSPRKKSITQTRGKFYRVIKSPAVAQRRRGAALRRAPSRTRRANSALMRATPTSSRGSQPATALAMPRIERRQSGVEIGAEFADPHALLEHVLEDLFEPARPLADAPPALGRQVLALVEEDPHIV